ncbi:MAG TPA: xanthine dehydrogenase accessory protein XdhC [Aestuariivirgaceae bacterium]|nr:xanthine dehydrogenase accessory protein XdhC [Aestuariivirgaceae bacterium]
MKPWATIVQALARHGRCAMVTVADTQGSAPREAGARMIVMPDGGFHGTIGGGALEWRALADARTLLAEDAPQARLRRQALGPELGQCCGGSVRLLIEVFNSRMADEVAELAAREASGGFASIAQHPQSGGALARKILDVPASQLPVEIAPDGTILETFARQARPLYLFGAGHVGRALVLALAPLPFEVTWIDQRREAFPAATPGNVRCVHLPDPAAALARAASETFVLVMTHSHALDLALVHAALEAERFAYVGLIGSTTKRARFRKRLGDLGLSAESISHLSCPIGLAGIASKAPAAIAASVAADLLIRHEAVEHGKEPVARHVERA